MGKATKLAEGEFEQESLRILRFPDVIRKTGYSRSSIQMRVRNGQFPKPVALGPRAVGFIEQEVTGWLNKQIEASRRAA